MQIKFFFIFTVIYTMTLTGCSFTSQSRSISPHFDGTIKFGNNVIDNAKIMLSTVADDKYCLKAKKFTRTDKQGKFNLKAIIEEYTYTPFVNYQLDSWSVCAIYNDQTYTLYSNNRYDSGNVTGSVYLECDLAGPVNKPCVVSN